MQNSPPSKKFGRYFRLFIKICFIFPLFFDPFCKSVRPFSTVVEPSYTIIYISLSMCFRASAAGIFRLVVRFCHLGLRTPRGTGFSPRRRVMQFPETPFSSIRLYERDVFFAKSLNCSAIFFASDDFVCRCASVGSVVDQKYPHAHGRQRFPCHFSVQLIEYIIY